MVVPIAPPYSFGVGTAVGDGIWRGSPAISATPIDEGNMTTDKAAVHQKIDDLAKSATDKVQKVISDFAEVATLAATKASEHVHDAGEKMKDAGEKMMKAAE